MSDLDENVTPITTPQFILRIRERIERGWTQDAFARNEYGEQVPSRAPEAVSWCLTGACNYDTAGDNWDCVAPFLRTATGWNSMVLWNDHPDRTKQEVLDALTSAHDLAVKEEAER